MSQELELQLKQQLKLNPQLQQSLKLLQLTQLELAQEIQLQLDSNPLLSCEEISHNFAESEKTSELITANSENFQHQSTQNNDNYWESIPEARDFKEHLESQLQFHHLSRLDLEIGYYLIENLNDQGFLMVSENEICDQIIQDTGQHLTTDEVLAIKHLIQTFEPSGCASANLQEFLQYQLQHSEQHLISKKARPIINAIVNEHFHLLVEQQLQKIEQRLSLQASEIKPLLNEIQKLRQRPNDYAQDQVDNYIRPDVKIFQDHGIWKSEVIQNQLPKLKLNQDYLQLAKQSTSVKDKKFIKDKTLQAQQFIQSLAARQSTLQRVADYLVQYQANYFEQGDIALKPLKLTNVADSLELHESTISRATSNKYCQTPNGMIRLKSLFSNAINTEKGGEWSQTAVKQQIQQLIEAEPSRKPLSDNSLVSLLANKWITIARRTVAKYRDALKIPSANKRKQLSALQ